ncbi:PREDICTED: probable sulfite oxidase, mitochondrial isoform X3 [Dinoponera quadriceps]|uniref:sulfite oxidase n=1 Tax=Dinoponera quadriceps TaxID=609295 RepID=A0A6P3XKF4_DINQU|nr:PREDICTED: probable sulfite oxidase, mitochondrial isoform X3 [Dinoponera quadriceps]
MNLSYWKMFHRMRQRSQVPLLQVVVKNYINGRRQCFTDKKNESFKTKQDSVLLYATYVATAASILGISYYTFRYKKSVYALSKTQDVECGKLREDMRTYTLEEVGKHDNKENRIWVTFGQGVYDITEFVDKHPGGPSKILMAAGGAIDPFWSIFANHNTPEIQSLLESMRIGNISEEDAKSNKNDSHDAYVNEPSRHKALIINNQKPFCAEPPSPLLVESFHTPNALFYVRNHLPVPEVDLKDYTLELTIEGETKETINFDELKRYKKHTITAAVMCGGNRRSEMAKVKKLRGLSWDVGAVGNATWTGARLCDVLKDLGINEDMFSHVQFEGHDLDPSGTPYGASIPISKAMDPRGDVILAYEMNGQPLSRDHGFPVRVIVPGVVGARNVKWLREPVAVAAGRLQRLLAKHKLGQCGLFQIARDTRNARNIGDLQPARFRCSRGEKREGRGERLRMVWWRPQDHSCRRDERQRRDLAYGGSVGARSQGEGRPILELDIVERGSARGREQRGD